MLLADKIVLVSGIGPGLGIELSTLAAVEGAAGVVVAARTPSKLDDAEAAIRARGLATRVVKVPTDIADASACRRLVEAGVDAFGRIDALVNSAFVAGPTYTVADISMYPDIHLHGVNDVGLDAYPNVRRWHDTIAARPAVQKAWETFS